VAITLTCSIKGAGGKTTLATHLAVWRSMQGRSVVLVDADENSATVSGWAATREQQQPESAPVTVVQRTGDLRPLIKSLAGRFDEVIVDAGGYDSEAMRSALVRANLVLSPVRPGVDVWTVERLQSRFVEARYSNPDLTALFVFNEVISLRSRLYRQAVEALAEAGCPSLGQLGRRDIFARALLDGLTTFELASSRAGTAVLEIRKLMEDLDGYEHEAAAVA
jgi:chromosome partitioning protein